MKRGTLLGAKPAPAPVVVPPRPLAAAALAAAPAARAKTREGKRNITAFIDEAAHRQLGQLALDTGTKKQDLFVEALNLLFERHRKARIA